MNLLTFFYSKVAALLTVSEMHMFLLLDGYWTHSQSLFDNYVKLTGGLAKRS